MFKGKRVIYGSCAVFDGPNVSLDLRHVLIVGTHAELNVEIRQFIAHGFKLVVSEKESDLEASGHVGSYNRLKVLNELTVVHGV